MAPVVLVLGNMAVQVTSALIRKQLMKYGFRVASNYKKYSNVTKVTSKNSANVLNKAKNLGQKLGKIKPTPTSPGGGKAVKLTDAMKKTARNAQKVSSKKFGDKKLSDSEKEMLTILNNEFNEVSNLFAPYQRKNSSRGKYLDKILELNSLSELIKNYN